MEEVSMLTPQTYINRRLDQQEGGLWQGEPSLLQNLEPYPSSWLLATSWTTVQIMYIFAPLMLGLAIQLALTDAVWAKEPVLNSRLNGHCGFLLAPSGHW